MATNKQVTLYHGRAPLLGDDKLQPILDRERQFCAVFDNQPAFAVDHNIATDVLFEMYGTDSAHLITPLIRPFLVREADGVSTFPDHLLGIGEAANLRGTGYRVGGFFFDEGIAGLVIPGLRQLNYDVEMKYQERRSA